MKTPATPGADTAIRQRCRPMLYDHRRRAAADRQSLDYGLPQLLALVEASPTCCYCGCPLTPGTFTIDHAMPTTRAANYSLANLRVCCIPDNLAKGLLSAEEYRQLLALLRTWHPRAGNDLLARLRSGGRRYSGSRGRRKTTIGPSAAPDSPAAT